jgi:glycosyltransferase involved in cell wall biosynthesis
MILKPEHREATSRAPTLSVLICTRNRADKLKRAVDSVLANSFTDFELIVVDQSTDGKSKELLATLDDSRLRYIPTNTVGVAKSRNVAARSSRAEIVVYTDDDCVCDREWLASIYAEFAADPTVLGVYGRVIPYGKHDGMICPCINESTERLVLEGPAIPHLCLGGGNNMSFRKSVFRKAGLFLESLGPGTRLNHAEDTEFSFRVLWHRCKIVYSPVPVVQHDKWLDGPGLAELNKGAVRGLGLVFLAYALRFDRLAFVQLLKTAYYLLNDKMAIGSVAVGLRYFTEGLALGPLYRLKRPPRLLDRSPGADRKASNIGFLPVEPRFPI